MTLALYGKSRGRQATLVVVALFAVLLAGAGALWQMQQAFAHNTDRSASVQCDGSWAASGTYVNGGDDSTSHKRLVMISNVKINGVAYNPAWASGAQSDTSVPGTASNGQWPDATSGVVAFPAGGVGNITHPGGSNVYYWVGAQSNFTIYDLTGAAGTFVAGGANWTGELRLYEPGNGTTTNTTTTTWNYNSGFSRTIQAPSAPTNCLTGTKQQSTDGTTFVTTDVTRSSGQNLWYKITATNYGTTGTLTDVTISDPMPGDANNSIQIVGGSTGYATVCSVSSTTVTCNGSGASEIDLGPGQSFYVIVKVTLDSNLACDRSFTNDASLDADNFSNTFTTNSVKTNLPACVRDLEITKSDTPEPVTNGQNITYTVTIKNIGNATVSKDVNLNDAVPTNTKLVSIAKSGHSNNWSCSPDNIVGSGIYSTATPTYTGNIACSTGDSFGPGDTTTFTIVVRVDAGFCGTITNTATVSTSGSGTGESAGVDGNNSATATTQSTGCTPNTVKIKIAKVLVGAESTDTFTADLSGSATENDIQFSTSTSPVRDVPYNGTYTLAEDTPGGGYTYSGYAIVGFDALCPLGSDGAAWTAGSATLANLTQDKKVCFRNGVVEGEVDCEGGDLCGFIRSPGFWKNWDNHFTTTQFQTIVTGTGTGLTIAQVEGYLNDTGQQCDRHLMAALLNLSWHSEFGGGIWNGGGPFQGMTISQILALASPGNCAEDGDGNATDFDSIDDLVRYLGAGGETGPCLILPPDCVELVAEKTQRVGDTPYTDQTINGLKPGDTVYYRISVKNEGQDPVTNLDIDDTLPASGAEVSETLTPPGSDPGKCSVSGTTVDCNDISLPVGAEFVLIVSMTLPAGNADFGCEDEFTNKFAYDSDQTDSEDSNTVTGVMEDCTPGLTAEKFQSEFQQGPGTKTDINVAPGDTVYYFLKVTNSGTQTLTNVTINDTQFDATVTQVSDPGNHCTPSGSTVSCSGITLTPGASYTAVYSLTVPAGSAGSECGPDLKNKFAADSDQTGSENSNEVTANVPDCAPAYTLTKEQSEFDQDWTKLDINVENGQDFWYKIVITNTGNETLAGLDVDDTLPSGLSNPQIVSQANSGMGADDACADPIVGTSLDCTIDTLYPGKTYTIVIKVTVPQDALCETTYTNSVSTSDNAGINGKHTDGIDAHTPECDPEVKVKKDPSAATVVQGDTFTYTIKVWNDGNVGQYVYLDDTLSGPGDIISVSSPNGAFDCETATYPAGDFLCDLGVVPVLSEANAWTFTVTVRADAGLKACETIDNRADIREQVDNKPGREIWTDDSGNEVDVIDCGDPYVEKSVNVSTTEFGQEVTYTITVGNKGSSIAYDVVVEDNLTNGLIVATDMPPGCQLEGTIPTATGFTCRGEVGAFDEITFSITVKVSESCEPLDNEIHLIFDAEGQQYSGGNIDTTNDSDSTGNGVTVTGCAPSINVEKNPPASGSVQFGGTFFYDIVVTNGGNANSGPFQVVDSLSGNGVITGVDVFGGDNACESNFTATGFTCQFEDLGFPPAANTITIRVFVQAGSAECTPVNNGVIVSSVGENEDIGERFEDSDVTDNAVSVVGCQADPAVQKSDNDADNIVQIGGQFTYTITVSNLGNAAAGNVVLSDTLVNGSVVSIESADGAFDCEVDPVAFPCTIGVLGIGESVSFTVTVQAAEECLQVENTASVANIGEGGNLSTSNDQDAADNIDIDGCDVDVDGSKAQGTNGVNFSASVLPLTPGGSVLYYQITATNVGNQVLNNVSITDGAPAGTSFIGIQNDGGGSCTAGSPFTCTIGTLGVGQSYTIVFSVQVANVECGLTVSNAATIAAGSSGTAGPGTGTEATNSVDAELDPCGTLIVDKTTVVNGVVNINDDDGWVITIASEECDFEAQAVTNAAGVAFFTNIPACDDYVVTEVIAQAPVDGYEPDGSPTVGGVVVPANGVATVSFVNVREDEEPTATPTGAATALPTNTPAPGQTVAGETVVATNTPGGTSTKVGGATVVATGTPLAPSTGNGIFGSGAGANLTLALFGMFAVGGGLILIAFGRRTRDQA